MKISAKLLLLLRSTAHSSRIQISQSGAYYTIPFCSSRGLMKSHKPLPVFHLDLSVKAALISPHIYFKSSPSGCDVFCRGKLYKAFAFFTRSEGPEKVIDGYTRIDCLTREREFCIFQGKPAVHTLFPHILGRKMAN